MVHDGYLDMTVYSSVFSCFNPLASIKKKKRNVHMNIGKRSAMVIYMCLIEIGK